MTGVFEAVLISRKVQLRYCSVRKDDGVSQLAQLLHESARSSGWVSEADVVVGAEVDIVDLVMHDVPAGLENRVADGHQRAFRASSFGDAVVALTQVGALVWLAAAAAVPSAPRSQGLPRRVRPVKCLPADSLLPGHMPAQDVRSAAVGNRDMSAPVSAMITSAVRRATPGMALSLSIVSAKHSVAAAICSSSAATVASTPSMRFSIIWQSRAWWSVNLP